MAAQIDQGNRKSRKRDKFVETFNGVSTLLHFSGREEQEAVRYAGLKFSCESVKMKQQRSN